MASHIIRVGSVEIMSLSDGTLEFDLCNFFPTIPNDDWRPYASHLTEEHNLLSPARGDRLIARGRVAKPGRTLTVCAADVVALDGGREKAVAAMLATLMAVTERPDVARGI